jgi:hypothetical protein
MFEIARRILPFVLTIDICPPVVREREMHVYFVWRVQVHDFKGRL